ncbi:hypothetical protein FJZ17_03695 [Candidatus Pacearchaeota archaeon]|nr:hypothetical protein [Candidatus Pacearchaeota archaeon]
MERKNKQIFWEALIIAIFIFGSGMFFGYFLEMGRVSKILEVAQQIELDLLDVKIQDNLLSLSEINCKNIGEEIMVFADRIYNEAQTLERYEESSQLTSGVIMQHKKYDLLRANLFVNALKLSEKCDKQFLTLVYFYEYDTKSLNKKAEQDTFSKKIIEFKNIKGNDVLLVPIAGNINASSINYLIKEYNITSFPTILINEVDKITTLEGLNKLEDY